jgi:hypothetical protein
VSIELARVTITQDIEDDGQPTTGLLIEPPDTPLVTVLGLLELAKDSAIRQAMGEDA